MSDERPLDVSAVRFDFTVPCDVRFRGMLDQITAKTVGYFDYAEPEAATLRAAVTHATSRVLQDAADTPYTSLALSYASAGGTLTVRVRYLTATGDGGAGEAIARILGDDGGPETPLDAMRKVATQVEIGRVDGADCCTFVLPLPRRS